MTRRHGHGGLEFNRRRQRWYKVVSIQVYSFELSIVSRTWRKELGIFTPKFFLVYVHAILVRLEVTEIFVQYQCLSSYQNDRFPQRVLA